MFTSPTCGSCQVALKSLDEVTRELRDNGLRVLVVTDAEPQVIQAVEAFRDSPIPVARVDDDVPTRLFRTYTTPFLYAIGDDGHVLAAREAVTTGQVREVLGRLRE